MSGFRGKILRIDLTNKEVKEEKLDLKAAQEFLGGSGLAAHYYWHYIKDFEEIPEPLSSDNPLIFSCVLWLKNYPVFQVSYHQDHVLKTLRVKEEEYADI